MKKNKLYILSSILIIISLFATAVTCNLCGIPIEITVPEEEKTEEKPEIEQQATITNQDSQNTEDTQSTEAPAGGNNSPAIQEVEFIGVDVEVAEAEGMFTDMPANPDLEGAPEFIFTIEAYDEDEDELTYSAYDSLGNSFDVTKTDNNNAEFIWNWPDTVGAYTLTAEVSDGKGGTDSQSVNMNFVEDSEDDGAVDFGEAVNNSPVIGNDLVIRGPAGVVTDLYTNQVFELSASVSDPDGHAVTHIWSAEAGEFHTDPNFPTVQWKTPATSGEYEISLTVNDSHGGIVTKNWYVIVQDH